MREPQREGGAILELRPVGKSGQRVKVSEILDAFLG